MVIGVPNGLSGCLVTRQGQRGWLTAAFGKDEIRWPGEQIEGVGVAKSVQSGRINVPGVESPN